MMMLIRVLRNPIVYPIGIGRCLNNLSILISKSIAEVKYCLFQVKFNGAIDLNGDARI